MYVMNPRVRTQSSTDASQCMDPGTTSFGEEWGRAEIAKHLRVCTGHDWPEDLIASYGVVIVRVVLSRLSSRYGHYLDESPRKSRGRHYWSDAPSNPAGLITKHVRSASTERKEEKR